MDERILSVVTSSSRRGAEVFAIDLADELSRQGAEIEVVALARGEGDHTLDIDVLGRSRRGLSTVMALRRRLMDADIVIANGSTTLPVTALATIGTRVPFIYRNVGDPRFWSSTAGRRRRTSWALQRASAVVALTRETAYALRECYGISPERIRAIPKAAPSAKFPPTDDSIRSSRRRELDLPDGPLVLYAGALSEEKRPDLAVQVVAACSRKTTLVMAGDGPLRAEVAELAQAKLADRAHLVGQVADLSSYLQAADVVLLPSDTEGLPGVAIEAGMTGIPVVATDVGWIREIIVDGRTGFVVPPGVVAPLANAIDRAVSERDALGAAARSRCLERFEIANVGRAWAALLDRVTITHREVRRCQPGAGVSDRPA